MNIPFYKVKYIYGAKISISVNVTTTDTSRVNQSNLTFLNQNEEGE